MRVVQGQEKVLVMNKAGLKLIIVVFAICLVSGLLCSEYMANSSLKSQIRDLQVQLAQSSQKADTFFIRDSIPVWKERVVEVDKTDYKKLLADRELIKELKLKVSQVEAENRTLLSTRDTVILKPINDSLLTYSDRWNRFSYDTNSRVLDWEVRDSLTTLVTREYKHRILWGLIKWGTKGYDVYIVNHNPRSRIKYNKYIRIKK